MSSSSSSLVLLDQDLKNLSLSSNPQTPNVLQHFLHDHPLIFKVAEETNDKKETIRCEICGVHIDLDGHHQFYHCKECSFSIHKSCAELPKQKKLLIFDLNEVLVKFLYDPKKNIKVHGGGRTDVIRVNNNVVYKRPGVDEFLRFCSENFEIAVWTSKLARNVDPVINGLFGQKKLLFKWYQENCKEKVMQPKSIFLKNLDNVWKSFPEYNQYNTILLDDSPEKAAENPNFTTVFPKKYLHTNQDDNELVLGGKLHKYLEALAMTCNVQEYIKKNNKAQPNLQ